MIEALETPQLINEAKEKMGKPLLEPRKVNRVIFVGDTHTAIDVTQTVFDKFYGDSDLVVFLGDYVDRGETGVENLGLITSKFLEDPSKLIMLRGNHESPLTNPYYGFLEEVTEKLGEASYDSFKEFFQAMPYAVVVNNYLCLHGGIATTLDTVSQIANLPFPDLNPDDPTAFQLLWNDPRDMIEGFIPSVRGDGAYYYGSDVTEKFLANNSLKGIIRGHEVVDGFREDLDGKVITIFSSKYHGGAAGVLILDGDKMEQIRLSGLTALYAELQSAFEIAQKSRLPGWIVLLTDGEPTDVTKPEQYSKLKMPTGFQMIEFGIGADYNQSILKALADASGGMLHNITDAQKLKLPSLMQESAVNEVGARNITVDFGTPDVKILNYKGPPVT